MPIRGGRAVKGVHQGGGDPTVDGGDAVASDAGYRKIGTTARRAAGGDKGTNLTTKGDIQAFSTVNARVAVGSGSLRPNADAAEGLSWLPLALTMAAAAPAAATPVTAITTGGIVKRTVFGDATLVPGAADAAIVNWQVETGIATAVYTTVQVCRLGVGITAGGRIAFNFVVPAGRRYQWTAGGGATVGTEAIGTYSFMDE
jgi:hypothetical protein